MRPLTDVRVATLRELPARIQIVGTDQVIENGGAYVRGGLLRVADSSAHLVAGMIDLEVAEIARVGRRQHLLTLSDGRQIDVQTTGRCACGSPLKRFDAWRG